MIVLVYGQPFAGCELQQDKKIKMKNLRELFHAARGMQHASLLACFARMRGPHFDLTRLYLLNDLQQIQGEVEILALRPTVAHLRSAASSPNSDTSHSPPDAASPP